MQLHFDSDDKDVSEVRRADLEKPGVQPHDVLEVQIRFLLAVQGRLEGARIIDGRTLR
jgi:hypothetical protein